MHAWLRGDGDSRARGAAPGAGAGADGAAVTFGDGGQGALTLGAEPWQLVGRGAADAPDAAGAATPPPAAPPAAGAPAAAGGADGRPAETTTQIGAGERLADGRSPHPDLGPGSARTSQPPASEPGSRQSTPPRPGGGAGNEIDAWRFVQATDIIGSADVPEALRVDAGARLAGDGVDIVSATAESGARK